MKALLITALSIILSAGAVCAQVANSENMSKEEAVIALKEYLTEDLVTASQPLNNDIDFVAKNYSEKELKALIKNYELITRKAAIREGNEYVPYDRRIDVDNPPEVKRFLKHRIDMIF